MGSKKIIIIIGVVLFVILAVGLYFLLFAPTPNSTVNQTGQTGTLPPTNNQSAGGAGAGSTTGSATSTSQLAQNFGPISDEPILDYFVNPGNIVTAIEPNGEVISVTDGNVSVLSSLQIQNIIGASFSYDGAKILVNFGSTQNPQTSIFDVATKAWLPMSAGLFSPVWSPVDYRIAYRTNPVGAKTFSMSDAETFATIDASKPKSSPVTLITLHAQDLSVAWPYKNQIVISTKPSAYVPGYEWLFDLQKKTISPILTGVFGLETLWSGQTAGFPSQEGVAFSAGDSNLGGTLSLVDTTGNDLQNLSFSTLPSKCSFAVGASSTPYLYCGVPRDQNIFSLGHLPDDYDQMSLFTSDNFYQINLQSGSFESVLSDPSQNFDASDVKFINNTLFFVNRYDQKLYGVQLGSSE